MTDLLESLQILKDELVQQWPQHVCDVAQPHTRQLNAHKRALRLNRRLRQAASAKQLKGWPLCKTKRPWSCLKTPLAMNARTALCWTLAPLRS